MLEYQMIKTKMLNREMKNGQQFIDDLASDLMKNQKAIFRTGNDTITIKMDEDSKPSATERFMNSIIDSQKLKIENLKNKYEEILIMINTVLLFSKVR